MDIFVSCSTVLAPYSMSICTVSANWDGSVRGALFRLDLSIVDVEPRSMIGS